MSDILPLYGRARIAADDSRSGFPHKATSGLFLVEEDGLAVPYLSHPDGSQEPASTRAFYAAQRAQGIYWITDPTYGASTSGTAAANTTAIQAAISAAAATGGTVMVPAGTFDINAAITLASGVTLAGVSERLSVIRQTLTNTDAIQAVGSAAWSPPVVQVTIRDLKIVGTGSGTGRGIFVQYGAVGIKLRDLWVVSHGSHGIAFDDTYSATLADLLLDSNGGDGWYAEGNANNIDIRRTLSLNNGGRGYAVVGGTTLTFVNADAEGNTGAGFDLRYVFAPTMLGCHMEENGADGTSPNVYLHYRTSTAEPTTAANIRGCLIQGGGVTKDGIVVDGANATTIEGNWFSNHLTDHIRTVVSNATRTIIGRNTYSGTGTQLTDNSTTTCRLGVDQTNLIWELAPGFYMPAVASQPGAGNAGTIWRSSSHNGHLRFEAADGIVRSLAMKLEGSATIDAPSIAAHSTYDTTIAVSGAETTDAVVVKPSSALEAGLMATGWVSAAGTVTVRIANITAGAIDPASAGYRVQILRSQI